MKYLKLSEYIQVPDYDMPQQILSGRLGFDADKCIQCRICTRVCPARSIKMNEVPLGRGKKMPALDELAPGVTACIACGCCVVTCTENAIRIEQGFNTTGFYKKISQLVKMTLPVQY